MAIPRKDSRLPERVKKLEDALRRIRLLPSVVLSEVQPTEVVKNSTWYDSGSGNEPKYFNGTEWVPVRDETIAVAQTTADVAQSTATTAASDAATAVSTANDAAAGAAAAQAAAEALQSDIDAAEAAVAAAQADLDTLTGTTLPALQSDLDAAEASITTLTGTTIPGLAADIAAAQAEVDGILPITETDISDDAITTPKLAAGAITAVKIAANTITAAQIAADAITASELAANAVTAGKIAAGTIVAADIASGTITATQIAANTITAAKIAAGTITATELAADSVTASQIAAGAIDGQTITGTWLRTAASGARLGFNDPSYPGEIALYTNDPDEIDPARIQSVNSGGTAYVRVVGPKITGMTGIPATLDLIANLTSGERQIELDADRFHLFSTVTTIDGFTSLKLGDGSDYITIAGQSVTDADLSDPSNTFVGKMLTDIQVAACTAGSGALTTTEIDVTGCSITLTTLRPNARYVVHGSFYFGANTGGGGVATGKLNVDGTNQTPFANFTGATTNDRASVAQTWTGTLASAGSHTLKLRAVMSGTGDFRFNATHTTITVQIFE